MVVAAHFDVKFCGTEEYGEMDYWYKIVYYFVAMTAQRFIFYMAFIFADTSCIASGLGYNGVDEKGNHLWDKIVGAYILDIELGSSPVEMFRAWNHQIHLWLKYYIYFRIVAPGSRPNLL